MRRRRDLRLQSPPDLSEASWAAFPLAGLFPSACSCSARGGTGLTYSVVSFTRSFRPPSCSQAQWCPALSPRPCPRTMAGRCPSDAGSARCAGDGGVPAGGLWLPRAELGLVGWVSGKSPSWPVCQGRHPPAVVTDTERGHYPAYGILRCCPWCPCPPRGRPWRLSVQLFRGSGSCCRWEDRHKKSSWRLALDGFTGFTLHAALHVRGSAPARCPNRMSMGAGNRQHHFWACPVAVGLREVMADCLGVGMLLCRRHLWLALPPPAVSGMLCVLLRLRPLSGVASFCMPCRVRACLAVHKPQRRSSRVFRVGLLT